MKLARFDIETIGFVNKSDKFHINNGDALQNIIIKDLISKMGLEDETVVLDFNEISSYRGETLIVPINQALSHDLSKYISKDIIPVFLGLSRDTSVISERELDYLRQFQPIGCRDEELYSFLISKGVRAYLAGCITITMSERSYVSPTAHPIIIDAPEYILKHVPSDILDKAEHITNVHYGDYKTIVNNYESFEDCVRKRYKYLSENASLVITSRMHVASPCIGMGIPVVLVRNSIDYRLSWIDKYVKIYNESTIDEIDWEVYSSKIDDFEQVKGLIEKNAITQIESVLKMYENSEIVSNIYRSRNKQVYEKHSFTEFATRYINNRWSHDDSFYYSLWGMNDAAEIIYRFINENYPNAKFCDAYDSYKYGDFHGNRIRKPTDIRKDDCFIFVTGYTASDAARELFNSIGIEPENYFLFDKVVRDNEKNNTKSC